MPCLECPDGTVRWGNNGPCEYDTMEDCMADHEDEMMEEALQPWHALLAIEGEATSDGRIFDEATWRELPLPFSWQVENWEGHSGSIVVGRIDSIERKDHELWGTGVIDLGQDAGREVVRQRRLDMQRGVSIDAAVGDGEVVREDDGTTRFSSVEIGGATIVSFPAFARAEWQLDETATEEAAAAVDPNHWSAWDEPTAEQVAEGIGQRLASSIEVPPDGTMSDVLHAAASGSTSLPLADKGRAWDGPGAAARVKSWAGGINSRYGRAFFVVDGDPKLAGSYHLGFADVIGGTLTAVPRGIMAAAGAVQGARGASNPAFQAAKPRIAAYYAKMDMKPPWQAGIAEVLTAAGQPWRPPRAWFENPNLGRRTGLHVEESGRIRGHLYGWGECHIGSPPGQCVQVPRGGDYSYICGVDGRGVICDDGEHVQTGPVVLSADHADLRGVTWLQAKDHYAHTGLAVADVVCGEDDYGIWVAGAVRPGTDPALVHCLRASGPSGDWRLVGGRLNLIAVLAVNVQGYPALAAAFSGGQVTALVAGTAPAGDCGCDEHDGVMEALERLAALEDEVRAPRRTAEATALLAGLGRDRDELCAELLAGIA